MKNKYYVYLHRRKDNNEVFYIGKGQGRRAYQKTKRNDWWCRIVDKYGLIVEFVETNLYEEDALALEIETIKFYRENNHTLCNLTDGGEGSSGYRHTQESLLKMSEFQNKPDHKRQKKLHKSKPVLCSNGMTFESCKDAEIWLGNSPYSSKVSTCCRREAYSTNGYVWRYLDDSEDLRKVLEQGKDAFVEFGCKNLLDKYSAKTVYCDNGMMFPSCGAVVRWLHSKGYVKVTTSHISKVCLRKAKSIHGLQFSYQDEFNHISDYTPGHFLYTEASTTE